MELIERQIVVERSGSRLGIRVFRWLIVIVVIAFIAINVVMPVGYAVFATASQSSAVGAAPDGFQNVSLITPDGVELAAWYAPPQNGAVIVVAHGAGGSRESMRSYARMLAGHGFGVLAFDQRGHGESGGPTNQFGWGGTRDVGAAMRFLQAQDGVEAIGGLGSSMGGEVLLGAASSYPALKAIAADGASYRSHEEFTALSSHGGLQSFPAWIMFSAVRLVTGEAAPEPTIIGSIMEASATPLLLIAAGNNPDEADFNTLFADTVGDRAELWIAPGVDHTGAFGRYPDEYERRVIGFFTSALLEG